MKINEVDSLIFYEALWSRPYVQIICRSWLKLIYEYSYTELEHSSKKLVQFVDEVEVKMVKREPEIVEVEIDERKMDRLLHLLHEADPQCDTSDPHEMLDLEGNHKYP